MTYSRKLQDKRWQKLRLEVMNRDGWRCQAPGCRTPENTMLQVHHKQYLPQCEPWDYPLENLITYCEDCHEKQHPKSNPMKEKIGASYLWSELPASLGFTPHGYLTQAKDGTVICGCFRLDYNPDAPDILLPGTDPFIAEQARLFAQQKNFIPVFVKAEDFGWEYCGKYRVESFTTNPAEIEIHASRAGRKAPISMILFLEKESEPS